MKWCVQYKYKSQQIFLFYSFGKSFFLIDFSRDKFRITGFSIRKNRISFGCSQDNIQITGSSIRKIRFPKLHFCFKPDYQLAKPESRIRKQSLLDQTGFPIMSIRKSEFETLANRHCYPPDPTNKPVHVIRKTVFCVEPCWSQPEFRLVQTEIPVSEAISTVPLSSSNRNPVLALSLKTDSSFSFFHSKIHLFSSFFTSN